jgi:hypothetical protein
MLASIASANISYLAASHFIGSDGLDTSVVAGNVTYPSMLSEDKILLADSMDASTSQQYSFTTGNIPKDSFEILTGQGGYITTADSPNLEGTTNFTLSASVYVGNTGNITRKASAVTFNTTSAGKVSANISSSTSGFVNDSAGFDGILIDELESYGIGQYIPSISSGTVNAVSFEIYGNGLPTGTANVTVRDYFTNALYGILGTINIATVPVGIPTWYTFSNPVSVTTNTSILVQIEVPPSTPADCIIIKFGATDTVYGQHERYGVLAGFETFDTSMEFNYSANNVYMESMSSVGIHQVELKNTNCLATFYIDSVLKSTIYGANMTNNGNSWLWLEGIPYADNISYSVGGTQQLYYAPNAIISGTTLPDRSVDVTTNNGVITWGTNPTGITVSMSSLSPSGSSTIITTTQTQDVAPKVKINPGQHLPTNAPPENPFSYLVNFMATGNTTGVGTGMYGVPPLVAWIIIATILSVGAYAGVFFLTHLGWLAGMFGGGVIGVFVAMHVFPWIALAISVMFVIVGILQQDR